MVILVGLMLVFGAIAAGYLLEHGQLLVLLQPAELLIICGAALGILLIANPSRNLKRLFASLWSIRRASPHSSEFYIDILKLIYVLMAYAQRLGVGVLEEHVEHPESSAVFNEHPAIFSDPAALTFLCDSIRSVTATGMTGDELDRLMGLDLDIQRRGHQQPVNALLNIADSLPGLGIVAAVLGVVLTMQALGGPAAGIGQKVAAALVGTFLGILMCYGVVGPIATNIQNRNRARVEVLHVLRSGLVAAVKGSSPMVSAEFARRTIPTELRPSFEEMENELRRNTRLPAVRQMEAE